MLTHGATLRSVEAPDRAGRVAPVVLGFDDLSSYEDRARNPYHGALVGRWANRLRDAAAVIDGRRWSLGANEGRHLLHGGPVGFDRAAWDAAAVEEDRRVGVRLTHVSPDGDQGFPGRLAVAVEWSLTPLGDGRPGAVLECSAAATTNRPTVVNLTCHPYWNLAGAGRVDDHVLALRAARVLPVDGEMLPTGEVAPVEGTRFDRQGGGRRLDADALDHCFLVDGSAGTVRPAARLVDPVSGRVLEVRTDQVGLQVYTGDGLPGVTGTGGVAHAPRHGVCLEPELPPDAPNVPVLAALADPVLRPGRAYRHRTEHVLTVDT